MNTARLLRSANLLHSLTFRISITVNQSPALAQHFGHYVVNRQLNDWKLVNVCFNSLRTECRSPLCSMTKESDISPSRGELFDLLKYAEEKRRFPLKWQQLWLLPHLSYKSGYRREFLDVMDIWWERMRSYVETKDVKITSLLIHSGRLQLDFPDVSIVEKLGGWRTIDFILGRMVELGFDRFLFRDVNSAVAGLLYLISFPASRSAKHRRPIHIKKLRKFPEWLRSFEEYILRVSPETKDWRSVIESDAAVALTLFRQFEIIPPKSVMLSLCTLCQLGFDSRDKTISPDDSWTTLTNYADAFLWFKIDPDTLVAGSWRSWYGNFRELLKACNAHADASRSPPLLVMNLASELGVIFGQGKTFNGIFDDWSSALLRKLEFDERLPKENPHIHLANLIYNLGTFTYKYRMQLVHLQQVHRIVDSLQKVFVEQKQIVSFRLFNRILAGIVRLRWSTEEAKKSSFETFSSLNQLPSKELLDILEQCCVRLAGDRRNFADANCTFAAEILLLLKRAYCQPHLGLLRALFDCICRAIDNLERKRIEKVLCYSGEACVEFCTWETLPVEGNCTDQDEIAQLYERFWIKWFAASEKFLQNPYYSSAEEINERLTYLLVVLIDAAVRAQRLDDFRRIQQLWEQRLLQILASNSGLTKNNRIKLFLAIRSLTKEKNWNFNPHVLANFVGTRYNV